MISDYKDLTPVQMRHLIREGKFTEPTSGLCPGYAQANLIIHGQPLYQICRRRLRYSQGFPQIQDL